MKTYINVDDFFKENNFDRFNEHEECFRKIVEELDFNTCKRILLRQLGWDGITIEILKKKYKQDVYLNNVYRINSRGNWTWDMIGDNMVRNRNAKIRFAFMSNCNKTYIAKACARMIVENYLKK